MLQTAKLFKNGQSQAVRLPRAYRFEGAEVYIKKVGEAVVLLPINHPWTTMFDSLNLFSDDYMDEREQPDEHQDREPLFE